MCGIFAYIGWNNVVKKLINGLKLLEYRWYDSSWIFVVDKNTNTYLQKSVWKVSNLANKVNINDHFYAWIAHTRWATHGWVKEENSHPHFSSNERFFLVHNGIIENYLQIRENLQQKWYKFYSDTDSEVIAKLIEDEFEKDLLTTIKKVTKILQWAYALAVIDKENPNQIVWLKLWSPLVVWIWKNEFYLSSDPNALSTYCDNFIPLNDKELVVLENDTYSIYNFDFEKTDKELLEFENYDIDSSKWEYEHFMLKEIFEIPQIFKNAIAGRINFATKEITSNTLSKLLEKNIKKIEIIASGTSYNAWYVWAYYFEDLANIPTTVHIWSEYKYKKKFIDKETLYIFISQSGETADSLECLKIINAKWGLTFGIVNVVWSSIAQLTSMWLYTHSWQEVWVASTKAFIWQLAVLLPLALSLWIKNNLDYARYEKIIKWIEELDKKLDEILNS